MKTKSNIQNNNYNYIKRFFSLLMLSAMLISMASCGNEESKISEMEEQIEELESKLEDAYRENESLKDRSHQYDFYITLGTMPTLYATLNAYAEKNPNTFMWFFRGNTISYDYTAPHINYFKTQSTTNADSTIDYSVIRRKVEDITELDPSAKFHLYCDDLRVLFIPHIFVYAGVDFEDLEVTFLSDGTGTYSFFNDQTDASYKNYKSEWESILKVYTEGRDDPDFIPPYSDNGQAMQLAHLAYYLSTLPNVELWVQNPDYLVSSSKTVMDAKKEMSIIKKDPAKMYAELDANTRIAYQKAVLANALVDNDSLTTLQDAVDYFDCRLKSTEKEAVIILGTNKPTLEENKYYIDETIKFYTPTLSDKDRNKVIYKNKIYDISEGDTTVTIEGKTLKIGELGVYLYFKGHPAHPPKEDLREYFNENGIEILPHRTPVETLFWMYDVKAGGFQSTSFLSCYEGQTEFFYEKPTTDALVLMMDAGYFDSAVIFEKSID